MLTYEELQVLCTLGWLVSIALAAGYVALPFRCDHRPGCPDCARESREKKTGAASRAEFCPLCRERHTPDEPHGPSRD